MEKQVKELSEITAAFRAGVADLQNLADRVNHLGGRIAKISSEFDKSGQDPAVLSTNKPLNADQGKLPKIIPFPKKNQAPDFRKVISAFQNETKKGPSIFYALPGSPLPPGIPDFRPVLQRDGLILLAWDYRKTGCGCRLTAYWVTSAGIPRFYASRLFTAEDFSSARPDHKSYAAEDGIEFYGQEAPVYMVHVAPELMKSNPRHGELRQIHIEVLLNQGIKSDFSYRYLLKNEKERKAPQKKEKKSVSDTVGA